MRIYYDDPDATIVDLEVPPAAKNFGARPTIHGLPPPNRLPASPPQSAGSGYLKRYPVELDEPLSLVIEWQDGASWSAR